MGFVQSQVTRETKLKAKKSKIIAVTAPYKICSMKQQQAMRDNDAGQEVQEMYLPS